MWMYYVFSPIVLIIRQRATSSSWNWPYKAVNGSDQTLRTIANSQHNDLGEVWTYLYQDIRLLNESLLNGLPEWPHGFFYFRIFWKECFVIFSNYRQVKEFEYYWY